MQNERDFLVGFVFYQRFGNHSRKAVYAFWRQAHIHIYSRKKNVDFLPPKPLTKFLRRNIISSLCGHGGTGRRVRLRGVWDDRPSSSLGGRTKSGIVDTAFSFVFNVLFGFCRSNRMKNIKSVRHYNRAYGYALQMRINIRDNYSLSAATTLLQQRRLAN